MGRVVGAVVGTSARSFGRALLAEPNVTRRRIRVEAASRIGLGAANHDPSARAKYAELLVVAQTRDDSSRQVVIQDLSGCQ